LIKYIDNLADKLINKPYQPTVGFNSNDNLYLATKYRSKHAKFTVWDLGGKKALRKIWENYYSECHCLIFMFD
jgi:ADP-ribosylation factor related protein 1